MLLRTRAIEIEKWNQEFWESHNKRFFDEREAFIAANKPEGSDTVPSDVMSEFYKSFLDKNWNFHFYYNVSWYMKNLELLILSAQSYREFKYLPPGPWGLPIFGYLMFMGKEKHTRFMELAKNYGSIYSARLGYQLTVVISDYKVVREIFRKEEFTGRPDTPFLKTINGFGIINSIGDLWKDQRKFLHDKLRLFGMTYLGNGKHIMEGRIMLEVKDLLTNLTKSVGQPVDLSPIYSVAVSNVICNIMMSVRFSIEDPKFRRLNYLIEEGMRLFGEIHTVDYIPSLQYLPGKRTARNKIAKNREDMFEFYREVIDDHKRTFDGNRIRDLIDTYLAEIVKATEEGRDKLLFEGKNHDQQIMQIMGDLFSAGMETIKTTLLWINVYMLRNPKSMKRVQEELDLVVGRHRLPSIEDLPYLPVTESTILESMRRSSIVPLATTHSPTRIHMDPNLWVNPEEFNPKRFIDTDGKVKKPEYFMPFGVGRDVLAKMEIFLFFATIAHSFDIVLPHGDLLPSLKGNVGVTLTPDNFKVCLTPRPLIPDQGPHVRNIGSS
ncbi:Cytochrome P450 18a1 [Pseudolycoriella hygida]|uniref:Cytochrome P450 18a1 n=1 Tax=Pseudolycoriella hygida TaxID=35572 RepID=A0A9Q0MSS1_9DIPT|nr:Cytochrome P450 18a1 [Pseudolycoriella hygida]